jgi:hypothetical protein
MELEALSDLIWVRTPYPLTLRCLANSAALYPIPDAADSEEVQTDVLQPSLQGFPDPVEQT